MDATMFRTTFVHPSILEEFAVVEKVQSDSQPIVNDGTGVVPTTDIASYPIVDNYFVLARNEANAFIGNLPIEVKGFFDVNSYIAKRAMVYIYNYIIQNKLEFVNLNLKGLTLNEEDIFEHIESLRDAENNDLKDMREEVQEYMKSSFLRTTSNNGMQSQGVRVSFGVMKNRRTGRYR